MSRRAPSGSRAASTALARGRRVRLRLRRRHTLLSHPSAREELRRAAEIPGMDAAKIEAVIAHVYAGALR